MKKLSLVILSFGLLLSCSKEAEESATPSSSEEIQSAPSYRAARIFKASFYSSVDTDPNIPPTACSGDLPGFANPGFFLHGTATHLGEIIWDQSRGQDLTCDLSFTTALLTTTVSGQIAAANGDLIYYTASDEIDASNFLAGTGTSGTIIGTWTITGGTGRFAGATGSFDISGPVDFATGTFSYEAEGTINY